jgi:hypothetical protein
MTQVAQSMPNLRQLWIDTGCGTGRPTVQAVLGARARRRSRRACSTSFSAPQSRLLKGISRFAVLVLMLSFGASFGYTVMGRISLCIGRVQEMLRLDKSPAAVAQITRNSRRWSRRDRDRLPRRVARAAAGRGRLVQAALEHESRVADAELVALGERDLAPECAGRSQGAVRRVCRARGSVRRGAISACFRLTFASKSHDALDARPMQVSVVTAKTAPSSCRRRTRSRWRRGREAGTVRSVASSSAWISVKLSNCP